jgi:hypothetical protein
MANENTYTRRTMLQTVSGLGALSLATVTIEEVTASKSNERSKREVEAEAVAYIVGRYVGLDTNGSAFYLAAWQDDDADAIQDRLGRIRTTAATIIEVVEQSRE